MRCIGCGEERPNSKGVRLLVVSRDTGHLMCLELCADTGIYRDECFAKWQERTRLLSVEVGAVIQHGEPMPPYWVNELRDPRLAERARLERARNKVLP